jgi:hypothetical protein
MITSNQRKQCNQNNQYGDRNSGKISEVKTKRRPEKTKLLFELLPSSPFLNETIFDTFAANAAVKWSGRLLGLVPRTTFGI